MRDGPVVRWVICVNDFVDFYSSIVISIFICYIVYYSSKGGLRRMENIWENVTKRHENNILKHTNTDFM